MSQRRPIHVPSSDIDDGYEQDVETSDYDATVEGDEEERIENYILSGRGCPSPPPGDSMLPQNNRHFHGSRHRHRAHEPEHRQRSSSIPIDVEHFRQRHHIAHNEAESSGGRRQMEHAHTIQEPATGQYYSKHDRHGEQFYDEPQSPDYHRDRGPDSPGVSDHHRRSKPANHLNRFFIGHHNRSNSYRTPGHRETYSTSQSPVDDEFEQFFRPRVSTLPGGEVQHESAASATEYETEERPMIRHFSKNKHGQVINQGDSYQDSRTSINSSESSKSTNGDGAAAFFEGCRAYKILMLGAVGVGKTALVGQFMSSECVSGYEFSNDEDEIKPVSLSLDGEDYFLTFIDHVICTDLATLCTTKELTTSDAYLVVFSVTDHSSFRKAVEVLEKLRSHKETRRKPIILVANKCDLVRSREVDEEDAKEAALNFECKFCEVSAGLKVNVDELLVGIVTQIKLKKKQKDSKKSDDSSPKSGGSSGKKRGHRQSSLGEKTRGFLEKIFGRTSGKDSPKETSVDNLNEL